MHQVISRSVEGNRATLALIFDHEGYAESSLGEAGTLAEQAEADPRGFVRSVLDWAERARPRERVADIGGAVVSSHELGVDLVDRLAPPPEIDLDTMTVDLFCYVTPEGYEWPVATNHEEHMALRRTISDVAELMVELTVEPPSLA